MKRNFAPSQPLWLLAACVSLSSPVLAQDRENPSGATEPGEEVQLGSDELQELLGPEVTPDQLIQFFTILSSDNRIDEALGPMLEELLTPGEKVEGWETSGIDILAELEAMPGGVSANLLRDLDDEVLTVQDFSGTARPDLTRFNSYALRPEPVGLVDDRTFFGFFPGIWFEVASQRSRIGNALCMSGYFGITLHSERAHSEWSENELLTTAAIFALVDRMSSMEACSIYERTEDGHYKTRTFTADGRTLPAFDEDDAVSVVMKATELGDFLRLEPATPQTQSE